MERIPSIEGKRAGWLAGSPEAIAASSIADLNHGKQALINEINQDYLDWRNGLSPWAKRALEISELSFLRRIFKEDPERYVEGALGFVHLPRIRHLPDQDPQNKGRIAIFDEGSELEIGLPNDLAKKIVKKLGIPFLSNEALRNQSWHSDVILWSDFSLQGVDSHTLLFTLNRHLIEPQIQRVLLDLRRALRQGLIIKEYPANR